jgi:hypothetical protein
MGDVVGFKVEYLALKSAGEVGGCSGGIFAELASVIR